jgi:hypothetical protein
MNDNQTNISERLGHEPIDVNTRSVAVSIAALMGTIVVGLIIIGGLMFLFSVIYGGPPEISPNTGFGITGTPPPDVRTADLKTLRATENKLLTEYAWADAEAGIARIPISRAMEIMVARIQQPTK